MPENQQQDPELLRELAGLVSKVDRIAKDVGPLADEAKVGELF